MTIPEEFSDICKSGPGMKYKDLEKVGEEFTSWVKTNSSISKGINGDPINWIEYQNEHNQTNLQI